jgi:hypothetical protein
MEDVVLFYGHCAYYTAIWYILWPFGILYGYLATLVKNEILFQAEILFQ